MLQMNDVTIMKGIRKGTTLNNFGIQHLTGYYK